MNPGTTSFLLAEFPKIYCHLAVAGWDSTSLLAVVDFLNTLFRKSTTASNEAHEMAAIVKFSLIKTILKEKLTEEKNMSIKNQVLGTPENPKISKDWEKFRLLALNLLFLRNEAGLDQRSFARKCGVSRNQYLRAEAGLGSLTLSTLFQICEALRLNIGELFKDPFKDRLRLETRTKIQSAGPANNENNYEERYVSRLNKNLGIRKIVLGEKQIRYLRLERKVKWEFVVLKGDVVLIFSEERKVLKAGEQLALEYNPQLSFGRNPREHFKMGSARGAEVLLIQTAAH